jgi:hypothetical protein
VQCKPAARGDRSAVQTDRPRGRSHTLQSQSSAAWEVQESVIAIAFGHLQALVLCRPGASVEWAPAPRHGHNLRTLSPELLGISGFWARLES